MRASQGSVRQSPWLCARILPSTEPGAVPLPEKPGGRPAACRRPSLTAPGAEEEELSRGTCRQAQPNSCPARTDLPRASGIRRIRSRKDPRGREVPRKPRWPPRDSSSTRPSPGPAGACLQTVLGGGGGGRGGKPQPQPARGRMTTERMDTEEAPARRSGLALTGWGGAGPAAPAQHRAPEVRARSRPGWLREASSSASASGPLPLPSPAVRGGG